MAATCLPHLGGATDRHEIFNTPPTALTTEDAVPTRYVFALHVRADPSRSFWSKVASSSLVSS